MNKRITSLLLSVVLVLLAVFVLHNERVVEAADNLVLLENRHPGYWEYLRPDKAVLYDYDGDGKEDAYVYLVSNKEFNELPYADIKLFFNGAQKSKRVYIDLLDCTGFQIIRDSNQVVYGNFDLGKLELSGQKQIVKDNKEYLSLDNSSGTKKYGVNGTEYYEKNLAETTNIY